jgi:hypothetical protein
MLEDLAAPKSSNPHTTCNIKRIMSLMSELNNVGTRKVLTKEAGSGRGGRGNRESPDRGKIEG